MYEIANPYYYIEYYPNESDQLQQVGSLLRITSFVNACHRVKIIQTLASIGDIKQDSLLYLDSSSYMLLKNQWLQSGVASASANPKDLLGKWKLLCETVMETRDMKVKTNQEIITYVNYFKKKDL